LRRRERRQQLPYASRSVRRQRRGVVGSAPFSSKISASRLQGYQYVQSLDRRLDRTALGTEPDHRWTVLALRRRAVEMGHGGRPRQPAIATWGIDDRLLVKVCDGRTPFNSAGNAHCWRRPPLGQHPRRSAQPGPRRLRCRPKPR
jgi:hypothetical protein